MNTTVINFAKEELQKYLKQLGIPADISLGLFEDYNVKMELEDPELDDAYVIDVHNNIGFIAGSNERSVLFGVYRLLEEWGMTWVRPGINGDHFPENPHSPDLKIREKAWKRHRTMCIEGAISFENILDMVDWLPKVAMNGYFIQFEDALTFFQRWYRHLANPYVEGKSLTQEEITDFMNVLVKEIKKRGLMLHRKGHGWHNLAFGISEDPEFQPKPEEIPREYLDLCAMVDGKRQLTFNNPFLTQLCYSNPKVINKIADAVTEYALKNPEVDYIHFWLSDHLNNTCECEECIKKICSDHYLNIVNEITDRFVEKGIKSKIVPLIYLDAIYVPKETELRNPQCVLLGYAPITRTFANTFPETFRRTEAPEYKINSFKKPLDIDENLSHLYTWQQKYGGEYVDFDYHLMWDFMLDAGGEGMAKVLYTDISHFDGLGLDGYISCQLNRNAFPTSVAMTEMAKLLWNKNADFDEVRTNLYKGMFGKRNVDKEKEYFALLSEKFDLGVLKGEKECKDIPAFKQGIIDALTAMEEFEKIIDANVIRYDPCEHDSWVYLKHHKVIYSLFGKAIVARLEGDDELCDKLMAESFDYAFKNEDVLKPVLDCYFLQRTLKNRFCFAKGGLDKVMLN